MPSRFSAAIGFVVLAVFYSPSGSLPASDCNGNGELDHVEIARREAADCNANDVPDACDVRAVNYGLSEPEPLFDRSPQDGMFVEDLDRDGLADIVILEVSPFWPSLDTLFVYWNQGNEEFGEPSEHPIQVPGRLWFGDADGNGSLDVVSAFYSGIHILPLVEKERRFLDVVTLFLLDPDSGTSLVDVDFAQMDGDPYPDLIAAEQFAVTIRSGRGDLEFDEPRRLQADSRPRCVEVGDFDGDGDVDIVTGNELNNVSVFLKHGAEFDVPRNYFAGGAVSHLVAEDLDRDGDLDLIFRTGLEEVTILDNDGDARFFEITRIRTRRGIDLFVSDVNGDDRSDIVARALGSGLELILNRGDGMFQRSVGEFDGIPLSGIGIGEFDGVPPVEIFLADGETVSAAKATLRTLSPDCNADGTPDECQLSGNDCNGNSRPDECDVGSGESMDCDRNGVPDECQEDCNENDIPDYCDIANGVSRDCNRNRVPDECDLNLGRPSYSPMLELAPDHDGRFELVDLEGDGDRDVVHWHGDPPSELAVFENRGDGTFEDERAIAVRSDPDFRLFDLDGDGDADGVGSTETGGIYFVENVEGRFQAPVLLLETDEKVAVSGWDLEGDGDLDLIVTPSIFRSVASIEIRLYWNQDMVFEGGVIHELDYFSGILLSDLDGDGLSDLLIRRRVHNQVPTEAQIHVLESDGAGGFQMRGILDPDVAFGCVLVGDLDADGDDDLVFGDLDSGTLWPFLTDGDSGVAGRPISIPLHCSRVLLDDLDRDGDADLLAITGEPRGWSPIDGPMELLPYLNLGDGTLHDAEPIPFLDSFKGGASVSSADVDGDLRADLIVRTTPCPNVPTCEASSLRIWRGESLPPPSRDEDDDGVPDECVRGPTFLRGDSNADGEHDQSDSVTILRYLFLGATEGIPCLKSADVNDSGDVDISDVVTSLSHLYLGANAPPPPSESCGVDPTADGLACSRFPACR